MLLSMLLPVIAPPVLDAIDIFSIDAASFASDRIDRELV
jgi:hypothetical protein